MSSPAPAHGQTGDKASGEEAVNAPTQASSGSSLPNNTNEAKLAAACGELLGLLLGATATVAVAGIQGLVLLFDISRKAIVNTCFQEGSTVEVEPVAYYVAAPPPPATVSMPISSTYTTVSAPPPQRVVVPRASSGYYSSTHGTFTPMHHYHA
ncbi:hypothetical protein cyc_00577 [Cyclospora cayetanensis]|uniref:Uncharacterized protein n=1 Tax=Cyclospora cayetanensis TaxID=88456 RepID=A0A1D3CYQ7_9EIME|nr:hypothetical protein cyc_00577 [Cyclospora cayetanensis]